MAVVETSSSTTQKPVSYVWLATQERPKTKEKRRAPDDPEGLFVDAGELDLGFGDGREGLNGSAPARFVVISIC